MSSEERAALRWALKLLDGFFALTGMEPKPESRDNMARLRALAGGR